MIALLRSIESICSSKLSGAPNLIWIVIDFYIGAYILHWAVELFSAVLEEASSRGRGRAAVDCRAQSSRGLMTWLSPERKR
jgi:hypothetical protein